MGKPKFDPSQPFEVVKPKFDPSQPYTEVTSSPELAAPSVGESVLRGAADWGSAGLADEIAGMLTGSGTGGLKQALSYLTGGDYSKDPEVQEYIKARDESRAAYKAAQEEHPTAYTLGGIGGGIASAIIPGRILGLGAKGVEAASAATAAEEAVPLLSKLGQAAKSGAISGGKMGAAYGLGSSEAEDTGTLAQDVALGGLLGAGTGAVLEPAISAAGAGIKAAGGKIAAGAKSLGKNIPALRPITEALGLGAEGKSALTAADREGIAQKVVDNKDELLGTINDWLKTQPKTEAAKEAKIPVEQAIKEFRDKIRQKGEKFDIIDEIQKVKDALESSESAQGTKAKEKALDIINEIISPKTELVKEIQEETIPAVKGGREKLEQKLLEKVDELKDKGINATYSIDETPSKIGDKEFFKGRINVDKAEYNAAKTPAPKVVGQVALSPEEMFAEGANEAYSSALAKQQKDLDKANKMLQKLKDKQTINKARLGEVKPGSQDTKLMQNIRNTDSAINELEYSIGSQKDAIEKFKANKDNFIQESSKKSAESQVGISQLKALMKQEAYKSKLAAEGKVSGYNVGVAPDAERGVLNVVKTPSESSFVNELAPEVSTFKEEAIPGIPAQKIQKEVTKEIQIPPSREMNVDQLFEHRDALINKAKQLGDNSEVSGHLMDAVKKIDDKLGEEFQNINNAYSAPEQAVKKMGFDNSLIQKLKDSPEAAKNLVDRMTSLFKRSSVEGLDSLESRNELASLKQELSNIPGIDANKIDTIYNNMIQAVKDYRVSKSIGEVRHLVTRFSIGAMPEYIANAIGLTGHKAAKIVSKIPSSSISPTREITQANARSIIQNIIKTNDKALMPVAKKLQEAEQSGDPLKYTQADFLSKQLGASQKITNSEK